MPLCRTCELVARRDAGGAPAWDRVHRTAHWDVAHAFGTSVEGWLVIVARRHVASLADLDDGAAAELGPLIRDVSRALGAAVGCEKTYVAQFAEHLQHRHVHVHVIPRAADQPAELLGPHVFAALGVDADRAVPASRMDAVAALVRQHLGRR